MSRKRLNTFRAAGTWLAVTAIGAGVALGGAVDATAAGPATARPASSAPAMAVTLISAQPHALPQNFPGSATLLTHTMPALNGGATRATTLLFVPAGRPPAGGWPIVGWIHGTTSTGGRDCAPSLSPDLDGGLTRDGFVSGYAAELAGLVNAGYAVVAPDLEGLGPEGKAPYPYYIRSSEPRSVIAGILAARDAEPTLSPRWVVFGHSEGAHGALGTEAYAGEAHGLTFLGTVAAAPYVALPAVATEFADQARAATEPAKQLTGRLMFNMQGMFMADALLAQTPSYDLSAIMGSDLKGLMPAFRQQCSVGAFNLVKAAVTTKGAAFDGLKPGWAQEPRMRAFLAANDQGVMPRYTLRQPALIVQGDADAFVSPHANGAWAAKLQGAGAPVIYKLYPGADHFSVLPRANSDVLAFLQARFGQ